MPTGHRYGATVPPTITLVDHPDQLEPALSTVAADVVGADVERADSDQYYREASLIQIGIEGVCVLVDPHAVTDLTALGGFLGARTAVFHAIENDLEPLSAAGIELGPVADTAVAAAMLGLPTGLGPLLEEVLGVELASDKGRFQRADWSRRPLPDDMIAYAAEDVVHLPTLWEALEDRLDTAGRLHWYEQELAATLSAAGEDRRAWYRTKGAGRLEPTARSVLRALWEEREAIAQEHDIAPGLVLHDSHMVELAEEPAADPGELSRRAARRQARTSAFADRLHAAQERGRAAPPEEPPSARRWDADDKAAYDAMRKARARRADELGIDSGVLCPSRVLWDAVLADPEDPDELCRAAGLRPWQTEELQDVLWEAYARDE